MPKIPRFLLLLLAIFLALLPLAILPAWASAPPAAPFFTPTNFPPVAISHTYTLNEDWAISIGAPGLLTGAFDPDGDPLSVLTVTLPSHGVIPFFGPDGTFGYASNPNFNGVDTFTYIISDGLLTGTATVSITVNPVNDFPVAFPEPYKTTQNIPLNAAAPGLLANDTDLELDPLSAFLTRPPLTGTLQLNSDGSFAYTPPLSYTGITSFTYTASDGNGYALDFDGVDDYVDVGDTFENFTAATFEAWVYHTPITGTYHEIYSKEVINSFSIHHDVGDVVHFNLGNGTSWGTAVESVSPIPSNQWTHLAATWDGATGEVRLYINGQLDNTGLNNIVIGDNASPRAIGSKPGVNPFFAAFPGKLDEVRAWNIVRPQAEIQASMYTHLTGTEPGLVHYYKMHEEVGYDFVNDVAGNTFAPMINMDPATAWVNSPFSFSAPTPVTLSILAPILGPDLTIPTLVAIPSNVCQGQDFTLLFAVTNQGSLDASEHQVFLYNDEFPSGFMHQIFTADISGGLAGQTRYFSLSASSFFTGTRYLKAMADGANWITETNELNNSATISITVQPDPAPSGTLLINGGASATFFPNLTLSLSADDIGNCATSAAEMRFTYEGVTTPWEPYTTTKEIIVTGIGKVQVAVQFKDDHNNESPWIPATIAVGVAKMFYLPVIWR